MRRATKTMKIAVAFQAFFIGWCFIIGFSTFTFVLLAVYGILDVVWFIEWRRYRRLLQPVEQCKFVRIVHADDTFDVHPLMGIPQPDGGTEWGFADDAVLLPTDRIEGHDRGLCIPAGDSINFPVDVSSIPPHLRPGYGMN